MDLFTDVTQYQQLFVFFKETNAVSIVQCTMFPNLVNLGSFIRIRFKLIKVCMASSAFKYFFNSSHYFSF